MCRQIRAMLFAFGPVFYATIYGIGMPSAAVNTMELEGYDNPSFSDRDRREVGLDEIRKSVEQPIGEITFGNRKKDFPPAPEMALEDKIKFGFLVGFPTLFFIIAIILTAAYN